jgi:ParB family transcriptional regulator, chromosome partitioning protein
MTHSDWYTAHHVDSGLPPREEWHVGSVKLVDPARVRVNRWHGRASSGLRSAHFESLKRDIAAAGGNVVPVLGCAPPGSSSIELVYGSLRVQACRELGLPAFIVVRGLLEREVFMTMVREGAGGWSLFELGTSIVRALDGGLFASRRTLTDACGLSHQVTSTAIEAARLPNFIVQAFGSPNKLTSAAVSKLAEALEADPAGVECRAKALQGTPTTSSKSVLAALLGDSASRD